MKEILGKTITKSSVLPNKITVNKTEVFDEKKLADELNNSITNWTEKHLLLTWN